MRNHAVAARSFPVHRRHRHARSRVVDLILHGYIALPLGVIIALIWANTAPEPYFIMSQTLSFAVNEVGMALFVGLTMQEIAEATMQGGALHSWRRWSLPLLAAAGGIAGSTAVYLAYVNVKHEPLLTGAWPLACAVDIAAAYYVLKFILPRSGVLPFVLLLSIATNLFGMVLVAPQHPILATYRGGVPMMAIAIGAAALMRTLRVREFWPYLLFCGTLSWFALYRDGLHPAFALVPIVPFLPHEPRRLDMLADPPDDDAVHHFEHEWNALVQAVLFLFGVVNGGVMIRGYDTGTWALLVASLAGRPLGILISVRLAVLAGWHLPRRLTWKQLTVAALATSSGFTFALFFATGMFSPGPLLAQLTMGALATAAGSLLAIGVARLLRVGRYSR